jgi:hypothetical protein
MKEAISTVDQWLSSLDLSQGLTAVGERYLVLAPAEARADILRTLLAQRHDADGPELGKVIQADFTASDTVALNGWILSRTESRLAALRVLQRDLVRPSPRTIPSP